MRCWLSVVVYCLLVGVGYLLFCVRCLLFVTFRLSPVA